jgi:hypothetical protein
MAKKKQEEVMIDTQYIVDHRMTEEAFAPIAAVVERAQSLLKSKVTSVPKYEKAADLLIETQQMIKAVEAHYKPVTDKLKKLNQIVKNFQKEELGPLEQAKDELKKQLEDYYSKQAKKLVEGKTPNISVDHVGEVTMVPRVLIEVEDETKIPKEYLKKVPDDKKLKAIHTTEPNKKIPGIKFIHIFSARPNMRAK